MNLLFPYRGYVIEDVDTSHYMKDFYAEPTALRNPKAKALLNYID
jgi:methionyl aminopeptidase